MESAPRPKQIASRSSDGCISISPACRRLPRRSTSFVNDARPDAYEQLVDRLLASPSFGERMATWWFDLVRFADTVGYHGDQDHRITPYRDYVIKSFNDNLPFDQFTIEQLAGDLLPNPTMWQIVATGLQPHPADHARRRRSRRRVPGHLPGRPCAEFLRDVDGRLDGLCPVPRPQVRPVLAGRFLTACRRSSPMSTSTVRSSLSAATTFRPQRPPEMLAWTLPVYEQCKELDAKIAKQEAALTGLMKKDWPKQRAELVKLKKERVELEEQFVPTMITKAVPPRKIRVLPRGNWMDNSGKVVQPHVPSFMKQIETDGRRANRLDLAKWVVSRENPLTARVVVNRLWKVYYGTGLSKLLIDMGSRGEVPLEPGSARLARARFHGPQLGYEIPHSANGDVGRVSAVVASAAGDRVHRPRESPAGPPIALPFRCRADSRQCARRSAACL